MNSQDAHLYCQKKAEDCQICFNYADKIPVQDFHQTMGGNSANAAVAFARLGFKSAFYTHLGDDELGDRIFRELKADKVETDYVVRDHGKASNYSTVINLEAERTILVYHVHRHYVFPKIEPAKWVYFSSMGEGSEEIFPDVVGYVQGAQAKLCYQPGTFQLRVGKIKTKAVLARTHVLVVNKQEAEDYLDQEPTANFRALLDGLLELGTRIAVVTDGPKGAYVSDGKEYLFLGIIKEAARIEATGAGDAFSSTFVAALAAGQSLSEALRWGQCQSSSVIQLVGAQAGLLNRPQLQKLLDTYPDLQPQKIA